MQQINTSVKLYFNFKNTNNSLLSINKFWQCVEIATGAQCQKVYRLLRLLIPNAYSMHHRISCIALRNQISATAINVWCYYFTHGSRKNLFEYDQNNENTYFASSPFTPVCASFYKKKYRTVVKVCLFWCKYVFIIYN